MAYSIDRLYKGDEVEVVENVPGLPRLFAGVHGWVVFTPDELGEKNVCTIRVSRGLGRRVWRVPTRNLRRIEPTPWSRHA